MPQKPIGRILAIKDPTKFSIAISDFVLGSPVDFRSLPVAQQAVYCISELETEVNNGGFEQFFFNSSGDTANETVTSLRNIGAKKCASIVEKAIALFPGGAPPHDRSKRRAMLEDASQRVRASWNRLDEKFFQYPDDLSGLLRKYVASNREQFISPTSRVKKAKPKLKRSSRD